MLLLIIFSKTEKQRHSFVLIANEQNQIEERLVHDSSNRYLLSKWRWGAIALLRLVNWLEGTILCFPLATSRTNPTPHYILLYTVGVGHNGSFQDLNVRINTGRDLYVGLFEQEG